MLIIPFLMASYTVVAIEIILRPEYFHASHLSNTTVGAIFLFGAFFLYIVSRVLYSMVQDTGTIISQSPIGMIIIQKDGTIGTFNSKMVKLAGLESAKQMIGLNIFDLRAYKQAGLDKYLRRGLAGEAFGAEVSYDLGDGRAVWRNYLGSPIFSENGKTVKGLLLTVEDITWRKVAEEKRVQSERSLAIAQQVSHTGNWDLHTDSGELSLSDESYRIFGLESEKLKLTYKQFLDFFHPDDRALVEKSIKDALGKGVAYDIESRVVLPDKKIRYVAQRGEAVLGSQKKRTRVVGTIQDITQRREAEDKQKKSEAQYRSLIESSPDCIKMLDKDGKLLQINKGGLEEHGFKSTKEIEGWDYLATIEKRYVTLIKQALKQAADGTISSVDVKHLGRDKVRGGSNREWCNMTFSPIKDAKGRVVNILAVSRDISEAIKLEQKNKELAELKNKFIRIVSHQLRTPLNAIRWNLESLLNDEVGKLTDSQKDIVRLTHEAETDVISRIHDMLTAIDIEEGRVVLDKAATSIESLFNSVIAESKKDAAAKEVALEVVPVQTPLPSVEVDAEKIRDVISAMLSNAITYTRNKGKVTVKLTQVDGRVRFEVTDNGIGIPKAEQGRIFTRFYRASNAATMQADASGLGLAIAKYYVEQHGGTIGFKSEEGKGSTFWFELPASA
ncbi:MAG: PAS domain-containing sensor histidine kinase [bacterium]